MAEFEHVIEERKYWEETIKELYKRRAFKEIKRVIQIMPTEGGLVGRCRRLLMHLLELNDDIDGIKELKYALGNMLEPSSISLRYECGKVSFEVMAYYVEEILKLEDLLAYSPVISEYAGSVGDLGLIKTMCHYGRIDLSDNVLEKAGTYHQNEVFKYVIDNASCGGEKGLTAEFMKLNKEEILFNACSAGLESLKHVIGKVGMSDDPEEIANVILIACSTGDTGCISFLLSEYHSILSNEHKLRILEEVSATGGPNIIDCVFGQICFDE